MAVRAAPVIVAAIAALVCAGVAVAAISGAPALKFKKVPAHLNKFVPLTEVVSPNGKTLYVVGNGTAGGLLVINLKHPSAKPKVITVGGAPVTDASGLAISPSGRKLYVSTAISSTEGEVQVADVGGSGASNNKVVGVLSDPHDLIASSAEGLPTLPLAISPNGKTLYIGTATGTSGVTAAGKIVMAKLHGTTGTVDKVYKTNTGDLQTMFGLAINPKGNRLYAANLFGLAAVLDVSGEKLSHPKLLPQVLSSAGLAVSADGKTLYSAVLDFLAVESGAKSSNAEVQAFSLGDKGSTASLKQAKVLPGHENLIGIATSPAGKLGYFAEFAQHSGSPGTYSSAIESFPAAAKPHK